MGWHLEHVDGDLFTLTPGGPCSGIEVSATGIQLDGRGKAYVRRSSSADRDNPIEIKLHEVFGSSTGYLTVKWKDGEQTLKVDLR